MRLWHSMLVQMMARPWWLSGGIPSSYVVAAYQAKGAASLAASYVNLANPGTYDLTPGSAPGWSAAAGWICDGSQWLKTGITPPNNRTWSMIGSFSNMSGNPSVVAGCYNSDTAGFVVQPRTVTANHLYMNGSRLQKANALAAGTMAVAGNYAYLDGVPEGAMAAGSGALREVYVLAYNGIGNPLGNCVGNVEAVAMYSAALSEAQVAALTASMEAL